MPDSLVLAAVPPGIREFLDRAEPPTPCLVIDLDIVRDRYLAIRQAMPAARICYAVKANPAPEVIRLLAALGADFDVASPAEITLCLDNGAAPESLSYGNTIKKARDIAFAHRHGVRLFTTDSIGDLEHIAAHAPGAAVFCRVLVQPPGAATPFGRKFGCSEDMAGDLLLRAAELGLRAHGVSFHVGSQQTDPDAWRTGIEHAARIGARLSTAGADLPMINLGGGFPTRYTDDVPSLADCAAAIDARLGEQFGDRRPAVVIEPGRAIVADAGVLRSEVVLVSRKSSADERRWVYLDVGRYGGLAETEGEAITYQLATRHDGEPDGPIVLAGPTCDGDDVLYQHTPYRLPLSLAAGDHVDLLAAGAYTASYSSVAFNGFAPLPTYCVGQPLATTVGAFTGRHVLAEFEGVDPALLNDVAFLHATLTRSLAEAGATVCDVVSKRFTPQGVTVLALLSESHASLHTYPELGSVFLDVFTCGHRADPELATRLLAEALAATSTNISTVRRGHPPVAVREVS
jgi:ornithine decarboxylase